MDRIISLIIILVLVFVIGYCGGADHGFHKLAAWLGFDENE